jgi:hypothetical protein
MLLSKTANTCKLMLSPDLWLKITKPNLSNSDYLIKTPSNNSLLLTELVFYCVTKLFSNKPEFNLDSSLLYKSHCPINNLASTTVERLSTQEFTCWPFMTNIIFMECKALKNWSLVLSSGSLWIIHVLPHSRISILKWRHDTQHNDIRHNDPQHKGLFCDTQHNDTGHKCCSA